MWVKGRRQRRKRKRKRKKRRRIELTTICIQKALLGKGKEVENEKEEEEEEEEEEETKEKKKGGKEKTNYDFFLRRLASFMLNCYRSKFIFFDLCLYLCRCEFYFILNITTLVSFCLYSYSSDGLHQNTTE